MSNPHAPHPLRIATRQSPLALWQAEHVASRLNDLGAATEIVPLISSGDVDMQPIQIGRQMGVFTKRIQQALLDDEGDVAVHSLKDLPTEVVPDLVLTAVPPRETVEDALVSPEGYTLQSLPENARIGTGSRRRAAQLLYARPDLLVTPIRGNVQTRLAKLEANEFDAIVLAEAGLLRLKLNDLSRVRLTLEEMLPAPGQGALGIETRTTDEVSAHWVRKLTDPATHASVMAERTLLARLHGGCLAPIAAHAMVADNQLTLTARVLSGDGKTRLHHQDTIELEGHDWLVAARELGCRMSEALADQGARELIEAQR